LESIKETKIDDTISFSIYLKAEAINRSSVTGSVSANINGTSNTTNGIGNYYVSLLEQGVQLIYSELSTINGFEDCNSDNVINSFNPLNNINLNSTEIMKFKFDILNLHVERQGGQTINVFVEYQYVNYFTNFRYNILRDYIIGVLKSDIDIDTYWENLEIYIAHNALDKFKKIAGIRINLVVLSNPIDEAGDHGPTFTYGVFD
jgi:hypothetical protein